MFSFLALNKDVLFQSAVYALAREMGFKVLEVNASMGRSGKQV